MDETIWKYLIEALLIVIPVLFANWSSRKKREQKEEELRQKEKIKRESRQKQNDDYQRRTYRRSIEKVYDKIVNTPDWIIRRDYYKGIEEDYQAYKELGGNTYIDTLMEEIRTHYKKQI